MDITVASGHTIRIQGQILDKTATPPVGFKPTTLKYTLWDKDKQDAGVAAIINSRNGTDILAGCDASGNYVIDLNKTDMALQDAAKDSETHLIQIIWTYNTTSDQGETTHRIGVTRTKVPTT